MTTPKNYPLVLTQQQYSDIMIALAKVEGNFAFLPMYYLYSQLEHLIAEDVKAAQEKPAKPRVRVKAKRAD